MEIVEKLGHDEPFSASFQDQGKVLGSCTVKCTVKTHV